MEISSSVRAVLFVTEFDDHPYATYGGTLFVVTFQGKLFGITCRHVFGDFPAEGLLVTQEKSGKKGSRFAAIQVIRYPSAPRRDAMHTERLHFHSSPMLPFLYGGWRRRARDREDG